MSTPPQPPQPQSSRSSYEELDSPSRSLPPVVPVLIAAVIVGALIFFVVRGNRPVTPASGTITRTFYVEQNTKDRVLAGVEVSVKNGSDKPIFVREVEVKVTAPNGEFTDSPAPGSDVPRYYQAYPALKQSNADGMPNNTKVMPGEQRDGLFIVGFPLTKEQWEQRKSLQVTINLYDQKPLIIKQ